MKFVDEKLAPYGVLVLRVGLGVGSLFLGFFLVAIGTLYRLSFDEEQGSEFR